MSGTMLRVVAMIVVCLAVIAVAAPLGSRIGAAMRGGDGAGGGAEGGPYRAVVSIPPLKSLVGGYMDGGDGAFAPVEVLVPPGVSEHGYEIPPSKLATLARADLVVLVGMGMEPQVERFLRANPRAGRKVIRFADVVGMEGDAHHHHHDHEHGEECDHGEVDPHLWLDPVLVRQLVEAVGMRIGEDMKARGREGSSEAWSEVVAARVAAVEGVHAAYERALGDVSRRTIVVGHDAWGHLARRYGLETVAIKGLMANEPTPAAIQAAMDTVRSKGLTTVFVEPQLSQAAGRRIAQATGARVDVLDPLGDGDWSRMMEKNLEVLVRALSE